MDKSAYEKAAQSGDWSVCLAAHESNVPDQLYFEPFIRVAAKTCNLEQLKWFKEKFPRDMLFVESHMELNLDSLNVMWNLDPSSVRGVSVETACKQGRLDALEWYHARQLLKDHVLWRCWNSAARYARLNVLAWLHERFPEMKDSHVLDAAIYGETVEGVTGCLDCVQLLLGWGFDFNNKWNTCWTSVAGARAQRIAEWLIQKGYATPERGFDARTLDAAIGTRDLEWIKWLHDRGCPIADHAYVAAIHEESWQIRIGDHSKEDAKNATEVRIWLESMHCPVTKEAFHKAICNQMLSLVVQNARPEWINEETLLLAISSHSWGALGWLRHRGCPWTPAATKKLTTCGFNEYWWTWAYDNHSADFPKAFELPKRYRYAVETIIWMHKRRLFDDPIALVSVQARILSDTSNLRLRITRLRSLKDAGVTLWRKSERILKRMCF